MGWEHCVFDLYGTLVDIRTDEASPRLWEAMAGVYRRDGADYEPEELRRAYLRTVRRMERGMVSPQDGPHGAHPEIRIERVFQALYQAKGVDAGLERAVRTGRRFRALSTAYIRLYDGTAELLRALRANGQKVWLLSNAQRIFTSRELERLGIATLFDGVYLSSDYGVKKPDRRFFRALLEERAIDPAGAVMVGNDGVCDILGAKAVGLATVYIRSNLSPDEPAPPADYALASMDLAKVRALLTGGPAKL